MGRGPLHLVARGVSDWLRIRGHDVDLIPIRLPDGFATEVESAIAIQRKISILAASACGEGRLPLLLAGNCNASLGLLAGVGSKDTGLVWFDAHGDFNTPETTLSGYFDGMGLAMIAGLCWRSLAASIPGFSPLEARDIVLVGAHDLDPGETNLMDQHGVRRFGADELRLDGVEATLRQVFYPINHHLSRLVVHIDLDVLDREEARVNQYSSVGGLTVKETVAILEWLSGRFQIAGLALSSYNPDIDEGDRALMAAQKILASTL